MTEPIPGLADPYLRPDQDLNCVVTNLPGSVPQVQLRVKSIRRRRRAFCLALGAVTLGMILIGLNSPSQLEFLAPGPLSGHHAQILAGQGGNRCAACHGAGNQSLSVWLRDTISGGKTCPTSQSELCLKCHASTASPATAADPHTTSREYLAERTASKRSRFRFAGFREPANSNRQLACAQCHREHHGAKFDLTAISDSQCQACHLQSFQKFEKDHPEFAWIPGRERRAIRFDHVTHANRHFAEKQTEFHCGQCHQPDSSSDVMQLTGFEKACGRCHSSTIALTGQKGWNLLELPTLDLTVLGQAGVDLGEWPESARGDFDGRLSDMAWALLAEQGNLREALQRLGPNYDFSETRLEDPQNLSDVGQVALGLKRLLRQLAVGSVESASDSNEPAGGQGLRPIRSQLPSRQFFQDALRIWFPQESKSMRGERMGWVPDRSAFFRWQESQELLAVNPLAGKIGIPVTDSQSETTGLVQNALSENRASEAGPSGTAIGRLPHDLTRLNADVNDGAKPGAGQDWENSLRNGVSQTDLAAPHEPPAAASELLARNPLVSPSRSNTDSIDNLDSQRSPHAPPQATIANQSNTAPAIEPVFSSDPLHTELPREGWYRDDQAYRLTYYLSQHSDPWIPSLLEWAAAGNSLESASRKRELSRSLHAESSPGQCMSCHTAAEADPGAGDPWKSLLRNPQERSFTRFKHGPHLLLQSCETCHQQLSPGERTAALQGAFAEAPASDFAAIRNSNCSNCHRENHAPQSCMTCHRYHIDP